MHTATRYHDISCGHRVTGHENKCAHLHGHNYRVRFRVQAHRTDLPVATHEQQGLDAVGRVLDFSVIKSRLCEWLEVNWDHKFLLWEEDFQACELYALDPEGVVFVPFNPTAENMAEYLVNVVGPQTLEGTGCTLVEVVVEETRKCSAEYYND